MRVLSSSPPPSPAPARRPARPSAALLACPSSHTKLQSCSFSSLAQAASRPSALVHCSTPRSAAQSYCCTSPFLLLCCSAAPLSCCCSSLPPQPPPPQVHHPRTHTQQQGLPPCLISRPKKYVCVSVVWYALCALRSVRLLLLSLAPLPHHPPIFPHPIQGPDTLAFALIHGLLYQHQLHLSPLLAGGRRTRAVPRLHARSPQQITQRQPAQGGRLVAAAAASASHSLADSQPAPHSWSPCQTDEGSMLAVQQTRRAREKLVMPSIAIGFG